VLLLDTAMEGPMKKLLVGFVVMTALAASPLRAQQDQQTSGLTGTWNMGLQGGHVIPVALVLKQQDKNLTGTIAMPTQHIGQTVDVPLSGQFAGGALKLSGTVEGAAEPTTLEISGKLLDDGTLEGTLSMPGHSVPWTAERLRQRR
jgi:hypothetical protein